MNPEIATDLLTPLGAYLRAARRRARRVPARVGRARPARTALVRRPRLAHRRLRRGGVARHAGRRLPRLRRRHAPRADGAAARAAARASDESRFVVPELLVRFDHARGIAEILVGDAGEAARLLDGAAAGGAARNRHARRAAPLPGARRAPAPRRAREGAHPRRRRLPGRDRAAGRAADVGVRVRALPRAAARQPFSVPLPARARRRRARRQLARDRRQVRGRARRREPDRRHDRARRRRRGGAPLLREGPRRARDARRPRPQRPLARLRARAACTSSA